MTIRHIVLVGKKKFIAVSLNSKYETFVVHVTFFSFIAFFSSISLDANIYPSHRPQIAGSIVNKALTKVFDRYVNFIDVLFPDLVFKLPKHTGINNHATKLVDSQQPLCGLIYSLELVELETLKAYIEINLANRFIRPYKLPINALIFSI